MGFQKEERENGHGRLVMSGSSNDSNEIFLCTKLPPCDIIRNMFLIPVLDLQRYLPWFWLALVVLFSVVEALTMTLTTIWFAAASLIMIFVAMLPVPIPVQLLLFVLFSVLLLVFTRPFVLKFFNIKKTATNSDALIGKRCRLLSAVTPDEKGTVRLKGVEWSVASADGSPIEAGKNCVIKEIQGNTLIVSGE